MKRKKNKRVASKKKQTSKSQTTKKKPVRKAVGAKSKKPVSNSKKAVKHAGSKKTSKPARKGAGASKGAWLPGSSGNPKGRPKLGDTKLDKLRTAIAYYVMGIKLNKKDPVTQFIRRSFKNDHVLIALMKKLFPDLKSIEQIELPADMYSPEEIKAMRDKFNKRFE